MKKSFFIAICCFALASFAMAQTYVPQQDVLGAHNNGGRGCAGCHQPHSGAGGSGGNAITGQTSDTTHSGDDFLFGQDLGPIYGLTLNMGDGGKFVEQIPAFSVDDEEIRGIGACLACHDGAVAKGAMMVGQSYEQRMGLLPSGVYGPNGIPTLLGADGHGTSYNNDHPVGQMATLGAAHLINSATDTTNVTVTFGTTGAVQSIVPTAGSNYANFVADYGMPAIAGTAYGYGVANPSGNTDPSKLYLLCTTCHNQHVMNVYKGVGKGAKNAYTSASDTGTYKTYFFINAPYNIDNMNQGGTTFNNKAASATQFCRECHFGVANENFGLSLPTQF